MRYNRFFGSASWRIDFSKETIKSSDEELINQLKNVLRLNNGDEIILCDGKLNEASCVIENIGRNEVIFKVIRVWQNNKEFIKDIILYCSVLKRENFELVIQKAVELGVKEIVPIISRRTVKLGLREDRAQKIIKEAAEQSGRGILPILSQEMPFEEAVALAGANDINLFFDQSGKSIDEFDLNKKTLRQAQGKVGIFIGPEGGWSDEEKFKIQDSKFKIVGLSPFTLRAETAAIAALVIVGQELGDRI